MIVQLVLGLFLFFIGSVPAMSSEKSLTLRTRHRLSGGSSQEKTEMVQSDKNWNPAQTAIIICDMWNQHWCQGATRRVSEMAPAMNEFIVLARDLGVLIIHAPSGCMAFYENHPARKNAQIAPLAEDFPRFMEKWCEKIDSEDQQQWPIDQSDGGCDDQPQCEQRQPWTHQIESIVIRNNDIISDDGREIWNVLQQHQIKNVVLAGVHLNMCVLGRPFGLRNLKQAGLDAVLCRDLTDTMYNSRKRPYVSHFEGTRRMIDYVEKFVCPTMVSTDFTGKPAFHFAVD